MAEEVDLENIYRKEQKKMNKLLLELYEVGSANQLGSDKSRLYDLMQRYTSIRQLAEIEDLKTVRLHTFPNDKNILLALATEEMEREAEVSRKTLEAIESKIEELKKVKAKAEEYLIEEEYTLKMLKKQGEEDGIVDKETGMILDQTIMSEHVDKLTEANIKMVALRKLRNKRIYQLQEFLSKYFPIPNEELEKIDLYRFHDLPPMNSLAAVIQTLVGEFLNNPHQWVTVKHEMWLPHVELLLRCGIAIRNPGNASQIRLQKFVD